MVILGLGSNVGMREEHLQAAVTKLSGLLAHMRLSRVFESKALACVHKEAGTDRPFLNMAVCGETGLSPDKVLMALKKIELDLGRVPRGVWGPREIDIDILDMDEQTWEQQDLIIPHVELLNRDFALIPLCDVAPQWRYPGKGLFHKMTAADIITAKGYTVNENLRDTGFHFDV